MTPFAQARLSMRREQAFEIPPNRPFWTHAGSPKVPLMTAGRVGTSPGPTNKDHLSVYRRSSVPEAAAGLSFFARSRSRSDRVGVSNGIPVRFSAED